MTRAATSTPEGDPGSDGQGSFGTPAELAQYVGDMADSLGRLARSANLDMLAHLLDMVRLEADSHGAPERGRQVRS